MRLLLDTHVALWAVGRSDRLSRQTAELIADPAHLKAVSVVSIWEIAIKHRLRRSGVNGMPLSGREARAEFEAANFAVLGVTADHAVAVDDLPTLHADPFDRMLIAQARTEPMHLVTADRHLAEYPAMVIVV